MNISDAFLYWSLGILPVMMRLIGEVLLVDDDDASGGVNSVIRRNKII